MLHFILITFVLINYYLFNGFAILSLPIIEFIYLIGTRRKALFV